MDRWWSPYLWVVRWAAWAAGALTVVAMVFEVTTSESYFRNGIGNGLGVLVGDSLFLFVFIFFFALPVVFLAGLFLVRILKDE